MRGREHRLVVGTKLLVGGGCDAVSQTKLDAAMFVDQGERPVGESAGGFDDGPADRVCVG
jgi:hypothetical protein